MAAEHPQAEALELPQALAYLEKRQAQMDYPRFQAQGWPIARGATESGNKLVVEARLKGAGMHWARAHVDPMLALRNVVCNNRWDEAWPQIAAQLRQQARDQGTARRHHRRALAHVEPQADVTPAPADPAGGSVTAAAMAVTSVSAPPPVSTALPAPRRPAANHPWRRGPACLPSRSRWSAN
jgi:hypothetical protein